MPGYILNTARQFYERKDPLIFYTDRKFLQRYRISKDVARILIKNYVATKRKKILRGIHAVPHRIKFLIAVRYFATGATYQSIGDIHGVSKSTVCRSVDKVTEYFHKHLQEYVHWPHTREEKNCKAMLFYKKHRKPKLFGLIDGTHVPVQCPRGVASDENQFFCYKGYYSINTMIVCDFDYLIIHVDASNPGSQNDIYCLNGSDIKILGERKQFGGYYLLGDSGYPLTDYLLTPVRVETTNADVAYNKWHRKTRSRVERTIGQLKQRWRCLDSSGGYLAHPPATAGKVIESCVALHNCAKVARNPLLKDSLDKDSFKPRFPPITQPDNVSRKPPAKFENLRKDFIKDHFPPRAANANANPQNPN